MIFPARPEKYAFILDLCVTDRRFRCIKRTFQSPVSPIGFDLPHKRCIDQDRMAFPPAADRDHDLPAPAFYI